MNEYVLDVTAPPRGAKLKLEIDRENVFEESPTAIVFTIEGKADSNAEGALDIGPVHVELDGIRADAVLSVTMDEAEEIHAVLGAMIAEVRGEAQATT